MSGKTSNKSGVNEPNQVDKFKKSARELGADESEEAFDDKLRRISKPLPKKDKPEQ